MPTTTVFYTQLTNYQPQFATQIPNIERQRAECRKNIKRQQLFILGRWLMGKALDFLGDSPHYQLNYNKHGKPYLTTPNAWQMNITHSGEHLFLVFRRHVAIGVDSELLLTRNYQRLAQKLFTSAEQESLERADNPTLAFYRLWTRYESQIKHLGLSVFSDLPDTPKCYLKSFLHDDLALSLCSSAPFKKVAFYQHHIEKKHHFIHFTPKSID